jgi:hypothetical protein
MQCRVSAPVERVHGEVAAVDSPMGTTLMAKSPSAKLLDHADRVSRGTAKRDKQKELRMLHAVFEDFRKRAGDDEALIGWWLANVPLLTFPADA